MPPVPPSLRRGDTGGDAGADAGPKQPLSISSVGGPVTLPLALCTAWTVGTQAQNLPLPLYALTSPFLPARPTCPWPWAGALSGRALEVGGAQCARQESGWWRRGRFRRREAGLHEGPEETKAVRRGRSGGLVSSW